MFEDITCKHTTNGCETKYIPEGVEQVTVVYFTNTDFEGNDHLQVLSRVLGKWEGITVWDKVLNSELERAAQHLPTYVETV